MMLFGEKYGDLVRVVEVDGFSRELCGGTHVRGTAEVGAFKVLSNRKHGADLYRIEVITGREALFYLTETAERAEEVAGSLRVPVEDLPEAVGRPARGGPGGPRGRARETLRQGLGEVGALVEGAEQVNGARVVTGQVVAADVKGSAPDLRRREEPPRRSRRPSSSPPPWTARPFWSPTCTPRSPRRCGPGTSSRRSRASSAAAGAAERPWPRPAAVTSRRSPTRWRGRARSWAARSPAPE